MAPPEAPIETGGSQEPPSAQTAVAAAPATHLAESEAPSKTPPRAPLVLRIGVTGHRPEPPETPVEARKRPSPDIAAIHETLEQVLEVIQNSFKGVADTSGHLFDLPPTGGLESPRGSLRVVSALAAGADQWVAQTALQREFELHAVLPFDREEYRRDFNHAEAGQYDQLLLKASAVLELDGKVDHDAKGNRKPDNRSYEAVGRAVLNQTDLLIAVWDGQPSHGRGGTAQIVAEGLRRGIPVVWIPWTTPNDWRLQKPVWRLLEHPEDAKGDASQLAEVVQDLLLPPEEKAESAAGCRESLRHAYFEERQKGGNLLHGVWLVFRNLVGGELFSRKGIKSAIDAFKVRSFERTEQAASAEDWVAKKSERNARMDHPIEERVRNWVDERFVKHYAWANGLSVYYGNLHRSAVVVNYLCGAFAVFLALVCMAQGVIGTAQTPYILAELLVIMGILALTHIGRRRRWHQRWIDYRTLAERLRLARCLSLFGGGGPQVVFAGHLASYGNPANTWMHWHYRAIERAAGVATVSFTSEYLLACQEFWRESLLQDQRNYHQPTTSRFTKLDHRLHRTGDWLFVATLIACVAHAAHLWIEDHSSFDWIPRRTSGWLILLCAFLPALGAAFAAIRSQCEAQRLAQRSQAMEEALKQLQLDLAGVSTSEKGLNSQRLRSCADRVSDLMIRETLDWRVVFQDHPLGLPS